MENQDDRLKRLRAMLDEHHQWPSQFMFKFVLPNDEKKIAELRTIFGESAEYSTRKSGKGNYISYTITMMMLSADHIFEHYQAASEIEGIISL